MYWIAKYLAHILQNIQVLVKNIFFISRNVNNITIKLDKNNKGLQLYLDDKFKNIEKQITSGVIPIFSFYEDEFNYFAFEKQYNSNKELIKLKENLELFTEIKEYTQDYHLNQEKINNLYIRNGYCNDDIYDLYNNIRRLNWLLLQIRKKKFIMAEFKKLNP